MGSRFESCKNLRIQLILWSLYSYVLFDPRPLTISLQIQLESSPFYDVPTYQVRCLLCKIFFNYWLVSIFLCPWVWLLTISHMTSKLIGTILLHCISVSISKVLEILSRRYLPMFRLNWPFTFDLLIWKSIGVFFYS